MNPSQVGGVEVEELVGHVDEDARESHVADVLHHEVEQGRQGLFVAASEGGPEILRKSEQK